MESTLIYIAETPLSVAILATIAVAVAISSISTFIVNEYFTYPELSPNNEMVGMKFGYFGEIFAVSLGLALLGAYGVSMGVRETSANEVTALRSLYYSLAEQKSDGTLHLDAAKSQAIVDYARSVADEEWKMQGQSKVNENTTAKLHNLFYVIIQNSETNPLITTQINWLNDVVKSRTMRTTTLIRSLSALVWVILLIGTALSLIIPLFIGTQHYLTHAFLSSLFSSFILLHLLVIVHLAYPFAGDVGITSGMYVEFLEEAQKLTMNSDLR